MTRTMNNLSQVITAATFGICTIPVAPGGRHRHPEHHVDGGHGTDAGDRGIRKALGARRRRNPRPVRHRGDRALAGRRPHRADPGLLARGPGALDAAACTPSVPPWAVGLSLAMSSGVGLVFGIYLAGRGRPGSTPWRPCVPRREATALEANVLDAQDRFWQWSPRPSNVQVATLVEGSARTDSAHDGERAAALPEVEPEPSADHQLSETCIMGTVDGTSTAEDVAGSRA